MYPLRLFSFIDTSISRSFFTPAPSSGVYVDASRIESQSLSGPDSQLLTGTMIWPALLLMVLVQECAAKPLSSLGRWNDLAEKHAWAEIPRGWEYESPAPADFPLKMRIGLKQDKIDDLIASLMETSDPNHARYGKHLSTAEADPLVAAHPDSHEAVNSWLKYHSIYPEDVTHSSGGGDWVILRVTVSQAERMLNAKYNVYHHLSSSERVVRTMSYSLPRQLHRHVDVVSPTTYFSTIRSMRATHFVQSESTQVKDTSQGVSTSAAAPPSSCNTVITLSCLRTLYNTSNYTPTATRINKLGVAGYLSEFANRADLQTFFNRYRTDAVGSNYTTVLVNGGSDNQTKPGVEANLDIQYTTGISFPTPNTYYSTGGSPPFVPDSQTPTDTNEPYLDWLNFILSQSTIPQTITTSYGDDEQSVPPDYAHAVCHRFAELGAKGITVLFSSGDFGVGGGDCKTNDGTDRVLFQPAFPASCPFVTAVGGTVKTNPEVAVGFSGGGFSRYFARPSYQTQAVKAFFSGLGTKYQGLYNVSGRAYPDVAAQSSGFQVVVGGRVISVGGTSASSPTVAGIFSLLNDVRLTRGQSSLGFINPLIYSTALKGFTDITSGSNPGCGTPGFTAGIGWDPVTGLGTPNFAKLRTLV